MDRAVPGKKIGGLPADQWNDAVAAGRAWRGDQLGQENEGGGFFSHDPPVLLIRNDTSNPLERFSIVGIGAPWASPSGKLDLFKTRATASGLQPTDKHRGKFAVLQSGCIAGGVTEAVVSGVVQCRVNIDDEEHQFADCTPGNTTALKSCSIGSAQIVWKESAAGTNVWCLVRLGNLVISPFLFGKLKESMCSGIPETTIKELEPVEACWEEELDEEITAKNRFSMAGCVNAKVLLLRTSEPDQESGWAIIMVSHKELLAVKDIYYDECKLQFDVHNITAMNCCEDPTTETIQMYEHHYLGEFVLDTELIESMDPQNHQCSLRLRGKQSSLCAFEPQTWGELNTLASLIANNVHVQLDTLDDGVCVNKYRQWIYTIGCALDADDEAQVFCTSDCDVGSGS